MDSTTAGTPIWTLISRNDGYFIIGRTGVANDFSIDPSGNTTFAGSVDAGTGIRIKTDTDAVIESIVADKSILFKGTDNTTAITALKLDIGQSGDATFNRSITADNGGQYRINDTGGTVRGRIKADATDGLQLRASSSNTPTSPERGLDINNDYSLFQGEVIIAGTNPVMEMVRINSTTTSGSTVFKVGDSTNFGNGYKANSEFQGDVDIKGDLTVDGNIIHGGGKSGIFNGDVATNNNTVDLFKITRTGNSFQGGGQLIFDVYATSELSGGGVLKYTVAHRFNVAPVYNKIIDSQGNNTMALTFTNSTSTGGTTGDSVLCQVTTNSTQNISYTVQVGFSNANTVVVT